MAELIETSNFVTDAVDRIADKIIAKHAQGGTFRLSLCGGSTPAPIYKALSDRKEIDWQQVLITFGDERCVGPEDEQSNYRMVKESLLESADVAEQNVVRIEGELDPRKAAEKCEEQLRELATATGEDIFKHDLVLLGMGEDGHTASLFPQSAALSETERWVSENFVASQDSWRLTMTYPLINAAEEVMFLVTGEKKKAIVEEIIGGNKEYPAAGIQPKSNQVVWLAGI